MTAPANVHIRSHDGYKPASTGCTEQGCRTQSTITLDPVFGRRCRAHPPWIAHARAGNLHAAFDSLAAWIGRGAA